MHLWKTASLNSVADLTLDVKVKQSIMVIHIFYLIASIVISSSYPQFNSSKFCGRVSFKHVPLPNTIIIYVAV